MGSQPPLPLFRSVLLEALLGHMAIAALKLDVQCRTRSLQAAGTPGTPTPLPEGWCAKYQPLGMARRPGPAPCGQQPLLRLLPAYSAGACRGH